MWPPEALDFLRELEERFRAAIDDDRLARGFERAVTTAAAAGLTLDEPVCAERVRSELESARPLVRWLGEHVGPSRRSRA